MSTEPSSQFARPHVDFAALIGLNDPRDGMDLAPIRAAMLDVGNRLAPFMLAANLVATAIAIQFLRGQFPLWALLAFGCISTATGLAVAVRRLTSRRQRHSVVSVEQLRSTALEGLSLGLVWSVAVVGFGLSATGESSLGLWIAVAILMTAATMAMAGLALATILFLAIVGITTSAIWSINTSPILGVAAVLFTALLIVACVLCARTLVSIRTSQIALSERDETVSLLLREFEENSADWLWEIDAQRRIVRASRRFAYSVGLDPIAINGMPFLQILAGASWESGEFSPSLRTLANKLKTREAFRDLPVPVTVNGEERWWEIAASPRHDEDGAFIGFRGVGSDVTEARLSTDRINRMARFDLLTGLPNRLLINESLALAMTEAEKWGGRCAFMMIDLDRFKAVNDSLGHPIGDRLLERVAERLQQLGTKNEVIGRLGGDEFAVVIRDARDTDRLESLARTIIATLSRPYEVDQHTLYIGASVGLAVGPRDGRTAETLIRSADLALYRSKDAGGGSFHSYEPQLHVKAEERRVLEIALRNALQNDELHLHFQPVVAADTGALTGFEALLRWTHPQLGPISPSKFVPLAEDARLIAPIGEWVLRHACAEAAKWDDDVRVAVNVSPEQLHNPAFVAVVAQAISQSGITPDRLELEVTESVFLREGTGAVKVLEHILSLGCRLSLDDFGTGYSSLGYLSRTRFSSIKIDRSFVQAASKGVAEPIAIIRAVVALAQSLGMATTAEGVETEDEHRMVQDLGCTKVQGYYFGRPLPASEAEHLATRRQRGEGIAA